MGVQAKIVIWGRSPDAIEQAAAAAFDRIGEFEHIMSDYRLTSEVSRLSSVPAGQEVVLSTELFEILADADRVSRASGGRFDVTAGPLTHLWREARRSGRWPSEEAWSIAAARVGYRYLALDAGKRSMTMSREGMVIDLGGIAKGCAAERAVEVLRAKGHSRCLVALAGDIAAGDPPPGQFGWRVRVGEGTDNNRPPLEVFLSNRCISTSGSEGQPLEINGTRYSHIVSPVTGRPLPANSGEIEEVTVIAKRGAWADAIPKSIYIGGLGEAAAVVSSFPDTAAIVYLRSGEVAIVDPSGILHPPLMGR